MAAAATSGPPPGPRLPRFVQTFFFIFGSRWFISRMYRRYGPIIRAWMEDQGSDRETNRLGVRSFKLIATRLGQRMEEAHAPQAVDATASVAALMAMLERFNYALVSRRLDLDDDVMLDTLAHIAHRGFFGAPPLVRAG